MGIQGKVLRSESEQVQEAQFNFLCKAMLGTGGTEIPRIKCQPTCVRMEAGYGASVETLESSSGVVVQIVPELLLQPIVSELNSEGAIGTA